MRHVQACAMRFWQVRRCWGFATSCCLYADIWCPIIARSPLIIKISSPCPSRSCSDYFLIQEWIYLETLQIFMIWICLFNCQKIEMTLHVATNIKKRPLLSPLSVRCWPLWCAHIFQWLSSTNIFGWTSFLHESKKIKHYSNNLLYSIVF